MPKISEEVLGIFTGTPKPLPLTNQTSAIIKDSKDSIEIFKDHLPGDECFDKKHHGGEDRVIHHYSLKNYQHLKSKFPDIADKFQLGTYGENITTAGLDESELCIGDIFSLGSAIVQLTEPRNPCATIDRRYEYNGILKEILNSRKYGWFYRVLEPGVLKKGDFLKLTERPYPELNLDKLIFEYRQSKDKDREFLKSAHHCPALSARYKKSLQKFA